MCRSRGKVPPQEDPFGVSPPSSLLLLFFLLLLIQCHLPSGQRLLDLPRPSLDPFVVIIARCRAAPESSRG
ncbi:uncharacterized protein LY79DRAFT_556579 [Colletotrichum navitas]|uniref:Uncharacterized protein n=1 Tax=Colletotrichum navitas TaxID=681940 RepID=A0AAD8V4S1_9PEZI|nr:uncharacterized protein LY79DRAFT_556579 [Colletotrichum navitas]KAK1589639.1 hypothetical protein LY79DRAFT_556579 [Colletotrichum navitas]